ncbi:tripartite tricarboxylate transporter permease [Ancylobacter mangrovi]|uniref:Tripartite tricarboxylate transporter permease n=1 Tax=Ancylobacter mangrovi TaxID=2972472 RepID=A0A9X2T2B0_9HYPH|nr:tripartite tricarboxylate transporter permease [Ancylobacter mangrovi]MCS0495682.1 tripartite tricarboxylate transporter permease [Ancylobacter mangrovi]MCS0502879.1 tripartite tricarboxylate transporter permease [Ancylobacter mangrovi]
MDSFVSLFHGLFIALQPGNVVYCLIGTLVGTLIGVLPGIGPLSAIAILLPITFYLEPVSALIMLAGIYYGAQYGGSTSAILINIPGENSSVVTCLDGHQMARRGRAGSALAVAALASLFAGIFATIVITLFAPPVSRLALMFGPAEYFSLMVLGLIAAIVLAHGSVLKALGMILLGLLLGCVGTDVASGSLRMALGIPELFDGIGFIPLAMGLFGVGEIIRNIENEHHQSVLEARVRNLWPSAEEFRRAWPAATRGTLIGSVLGILPGGGAMLSSFAAYTIEKKISKEPGRFGKGAVEGVAAPEAANNAGAQTSFIPLLTLGIPSNAMMALMAGALLIHGIQPGPRVITNNPEIFWGLIASMLVGNALLVVINLPLIGIWTQLLRVPYHLFYPMILVFCCIGVYTVNSSVLDVMLLMIFGFFGYMFIKWQCEPAPLLLAFILGPLMEENLRRAMEVSYGDPAIFVTRPISAVLLIAAAGCLVLVLLPAFQRTREVAFQDES